MKASVAWATKIRDTRNIADFTCWEDCGFYRKALHRLLRDVGATAVAMKRTAEE